MNDARTPSGSVAMNQDGVPLHPIQATSDAALLDAMRRTPRALEPWDIARMNQVKDLGNLMHEQFTRLGNSREMSIAKTKIEEAVMWAVKHITGPA